MKAFGGRGIWPFLRFRVWDEPGVNGRCVTTVGEGEEEGTPSDILDVNAGGDGKNGSGTGVATLLLPP